MTATPFRSGGLTAIPKIAVRIVAAYGVALALLLHSPVVDWLAKPLIVPTAAAGRADAIVVLGAWASAAGDLNESGLRRTLCAAELHQRGIASVVLITGSTPVASDDGSSVQAMAGLLRNLGVPQDSIETETRSANTHESAVHVAAIARARGWQRVALVTDAGHERRAVGAFRKAGLDATPSSPAAVWDIARDRPLLRLHTLGTLVNEYGGLLYYFLRGWI